MTERQKKITEIRKLLMKTNQTISREKFMQVIPDNPVDAVSPEQLADELNLPDFIVRSWTKGMHTTSDGRIWSDGNSKENYVRRIGEI